MSELTPEQRLIVALDVSPDRMSGLLDALSGVATLKIGLEAYCRDGADLVREVRGRGHDVFLDLKLHDIPNTVARAAAVVADLGVRFLTVHASGGGEMIRAAVDAGKRASPDLRVIGVTMLTSLAGDELPGVWDPGTSAGEKVLLLARIAMDAGCDGVVASAREARSLRERLGDRAILVCPGIRPAGAPAVDQTRVATPTSAVKAGADHLVVGRPITGAGDPRVAADAIIEEIRLALGD